MLSNRINTSEERINELEDRVKEIIQNAIQKNKIYKTKIDMLSRRIR